MERIVNMGCNRINRTQSSISNPTYACWDVINSIKYDKPNKVFYRIVKRKKIYINLVMIAVSMKQ